MSRLKGLLATLPRLNIEPIPSREYPRPIFTLFPELPGELRNKIWMFAAFDPRCIQLRSYHSHKTNRTDVPDHSRVPVILQTNRESRAEGLRYYVKCHEKPTDLEAYRHLFNPNPDAMPITGNVVYINFEIDIFICHPNQISRSDQGRDEFNIETSDLAKFRHLLIFTVAWRYGYRLARLFGAHALENAQVRVLPSTMARRKETVEGHLELRDYINHIKRNMKISQLRKIVATRQSVVRLGIRFEVGDYADLDPCEAVITEGVVVDDEANT